MMNRLAAALLLLCPAFGWSGNAEHPDDPHYTPSGFFDLHMCNWPDRPLFYLALYSTYAFDNIRSVDVVDAAGRPVGPLDMDRYMRINREGKPEKRVFLAHLPVPDDRPDGWYRAVVTLNNGEQHEARDFVIHQVMAQARGHQPPPGAGAVQLPVELGWDRVDGAAYYQVSVRDLWQDRKLIHTSELLKENRYRLPDGLVAPGGSYEWKVHARDLDGHIQLGDFNIGSQSEWVEFTVAD